MALNNKRCAECGQFVKDSYVGDFEVSETGKYVVKKPRYCAKCKLWKIWKRSSITEIEYELEYYSEEYYQEERKSENQAGDNE